MKRWEIVSMSTGGVLLVGSALAFGTAAVNALGAALVAVPPVLFVARAVEDRLVAPRAG